MADNLQEINCPACGAEMVKVFMPQQGVNIDVCVNGCGGIYFDNREFSKFDEPHEDISPLIEVLKNKEFKPVDESMTRKCPVCGSDMVKNFASARREIEVDECYSCGGKFLDCKELDKIRAQYNTEEERAADALKLLYEAAGAELNPPPSLLNDGKNWKKGALIGVLAGIIADIYLFNKYYDMLSSIPPEQAIGYTAAMAAGICFICAGLGALIFKLSSNRGRA